MTKVILMVVMMGVIAVVSAASARAQTSKTTGAAGSAATQTPATGPASRPGGKAGAHIGQSQHPGFAPLTKNECRKLGGSLQDDTRCKNAKRCVITLANGDVNSICIDEFDSERN